MTALAPVFAVMVVGRLIYGLGIGLVSFDWILFAVA